MKNLYKNKKDQQRFRNFNELRWAIFLELQGYKYYYIDGDFLIDGANNKEITLQVVDDINDLKDIKIDIYQSYNIVVDGNPFFRSTENEYGIAIGFVYEDNMDINSEYDELAWSDLCVKNEFDFSSYMRNWDGIFKDSTERKDFAEINDRCVNALKDKWETANTIAKLINNILISSNAKTL
jgi:hypothetical protein